MILEPYSIGVGDRFAQQGRAQLRALIAAAEQGVSVTPVWNKSHREHSTIGTTPDDVRTEADEAVRASGWRGAYHVDADHIGLDNVDLFLQASDFFTLDVADFIGRDAGEEQVRTFLRKHEKYVGELTIPGIDRALRITGEMMESIARKFLAAARQAGNIYRHIERVKGEGDFITEVSMDETDQPQTPVEMFFILAAVSDEGIPAQTVAPKFTGDFYKGVDYVGETPAFARELGEDLAVIAFAVEEFGLPGSLKLSVHSGSDKFSLYPLMHEAIRRRGAGLHLKTAGTTWLEELIGLALAGGEGLAIAKDVYRQAVSRVDELCAPYAKVVDIDPARLPSPETVDGWCGEEVASALRHDAACARYNRDFRQLLHVAYRIAAEMGERYLGAVRSAEAVIGPEVTANILERHVKPVFLGR